MQLRVVGCHGGETPKHRTCAFLLDERLAIDAGSLTSELDLPLQCRLEAVLVSHSHLDHVLAIGLLADAVMRLRRSLGRPPVQVHALPETLAALRQNIFNGVIWPDFTRLPSAEAPVLRLVPLALGELLHLNGKRIEVLSAAHTVPAVGFAVDGSARGGAPDAGWWVYTGDTGPNPALWERLGRMSKISHLIIETAFSDDEAPLARLSQHLFPEALGQELAQLAGSVEVHITHVKPGETDAVMRDIGQIATAHRISALATGQVMQLG